MVHSGGARMGAPGAGPIPKVPWAPRMAPPYLTLKQTAMLNPCEISMDSVGRTARHPQYTEYESLRDHKI